MNVQLPKTMAAVMCHGPEGYRLEKGLLPMEDIVTHQLPLGRYLDGIEAAAGGTKSVKVTLEP